MNVRIVDSQGLLSEQQKAYARHRLVYALARFESRINSVTLNYWLDENLDVNSTAKVSVEGVGIISVTRSGKSASEVLNFVTDATESRLAFRLDWRALMNFEVLATWLQSAGQAIFRRLSWFGQKRQKSSIHSKSGNDRSSGRAHKKIPGRFAAQELP